MTTELSEKQVAAPTKAKKPDKREAIVEAAKVLFTTVGYENTTIADVAKKAGVAVGTVYLYFKNKNELLFAVQGGWEENYVAYITQPEIRDIPHYLRGRLLIEASFKMCEEQSEMIQLMGLQPQNIGEMYHDKPLIRQVIKTFLDEGIALGMFRPIDTGIAAGIAFGMVHTALDECYGMRGGEEKERYIATLVDLFGHWLLTPEYLQAVQ